MLLIMELITSRNVELCLSASRLENYWSKSVLLKLVRKQAAFFQKSIHRNSEYQNNNRRIYLCAILWVSFLAFSFHLFFVSYKVEHEFAQKLCDCLHYFCTEIELYFAFLFDFFSGQLGHDLLFINLFFSAHTSTST